MKCIGLIPARGGSKEVPGKNIRPLGGKPLIAHTIEAACTATSLDAVVVSTDDPNIAAVARKCGAEVPFLRPASIAQDSTPDRPVMLHMIDWWQKKRGADCSILAYLRPTTPFKSAELIDRCIKKLKSDQTLSAVRTVTAIKGVYHPFWMMKIINNNLFPFIDGLGEKAHSRRQLLPPCYAVNGVVDVLRIDQILSSEDIYGAYIGAITISEEAAVDIDTLIDLQWCEFLIQKRRQSD